MQNPIESTEDAPQWAIVELMGHGVAAGRITKDTQFGTALLRLDVPVKDGFVTQLINPASVYRMTYVEEAIARGVAQNNEPRPVSEWSLRHLLPEPDKEDHPTETVAYGFQDDDDSPL